MARRTPNRKTAATKTNPFEKFLGPEDLIHIQVCRFAKLQYKGLVSHHSPNEGKRTPFERYKMKLYGVSAGFPDLIMIYKGKMIAIELKAGTNTATAAQAEWIALLNSCGIPAAVCNTYDKAVIFIRYHFDKLR